jgi:hypothetical protein
MASVKMECFTDRRSMLCAFSLSLCKLAIFEFAATAKERQMSPRVRMLASFILFIATLTIVQAYGQQDTASSQAADENTTEGTVTSANRDALVIRTDDNHYQVFSYVPGAVRAKSLAPGARVRVASGPADENGTRSASSVTVLSAAASGADKTTQAAPVPDKVRDVESDIRRESRRWALGVRAGAAFDPELFTFGVQSQMGPIFHPRVVFRPNAEFAFGEVTDLIAINLEGVYRFSRAARRGNWTPYLGAGPALIFIHQNFQAGRDIDFGNFDYETGFNILAGMQSRKGMFVELKSSLYSGPAPKLRLLFGYNF